MTTPPVIVEVIFDTSSAKKELNSFKQDIITAIKGGFQEGTSQAATSGLADSIKQLTEAFKKAAAEGAKLQAATQAQAQAQSQSTTVTNQAANAQRNRANALSVSLAATLKGVTAGQRFAQELLKEVAAAGVGFSTLTSLAQATNVFSTEQVLAARHVALLEKEFNEINEAFVKGTANINQLENAIKNLIGSQVALERVLKNTAATQEQVNQARARGFANALNQKNAEQQATAELVRQAQVLGNNQRELVQIAQATKAFTEAEIKLAIETAELSTKFEILASKMNRTEQEQRELQQVSSQLGKNLAVQNQNASTGVQSFGQLQVAFAKFNNVLAAVRNVIQIVDEVLGGLYRTARQGAVIDQTTQSFNRFASEVVGIPDLLQQAGEAARGTISDFELASQTLTLISGLTPDLAKTFSEALIGAGDFSTSLLDVARAAQILNPSLGDVDFFLKSLSIGIKRNERRWIDNLGIVISARESYQRFSEATGKSVLELTAQDKQLATLNETLRVGQLLIDQVGDSVESQVDTFARFETSWENLANSISITIKDTLLPWIQLINGEFTPSVDNAANSLFEFNKSVIEQREARAAASIFDYNGLTEGQIRIDALRESLKDLREFRDAPPVSITDFVLGISNREAEKQIANLATLLVQDVEDVAQFEGIITGVFEGEELAARNALIRELRESGEIDLGEAEFLKRTASLRTIIPIFFEAIEAQERFARGGNLVNRVFDNFQKSSQQAAIELQNVKAKIDEITTESLGNQLKIVEEYNDAIDDLGRQKALDKLASSFVDLGAELFQSFDLGEQAFLDFRVRIGDLSQESADLRAETILLNDEIRQLFVLFAEQGIDDTTILADAFDILRLGLAETADEALKLAQNEEFVTTELEKSREAALKDKLALEELEEATRATSEATDALRDALNSVVESGFDKARSAISDYVEALEGKNKAEGESKTVTIDNSRRIAEINEKLFGDLDKDTRENLENRLKELRESGEDISQEYASILDRLDDALSRADRDTLIQELFELQAEQGLVVTGIFGRDPKAIKEFEADAQEAIEELINARRETVVALFTEARDIDFETEVALLLDFELIDDFEAELLIKERQIFDSINAIFGAGSVIRLDATTTIDFGEILLQELGTEGVANLEAQISSLIGELEAGQEVQEVITIGLNLVLEQKIKAEDLDQFITDAFAGLERGEDAVTAVAVALVPEIQTGQAREALRQELASEFSGGLPLNPQEIAELEKIDQAFVDARTEAVNLRQEVKQFVEEPEKKEIEIIAETEEAERLIQEFLDAIPEQIIIEFGFTFPEFSEFPSPPQPPSPPPSGAYGGWFPDGVRDTPSERVGEYADATNNSSPAYGTQTTNNVSNNTTTTNYVDRSTTNVTNVTNYVANDARPVPDYFV